MHHLVAAPFDIFSPSVLSLAIEAWTWVIGERPDIEAAFVSEIVAAWGSTVVRRKGLYSDSIK